jgi:short-subunit dehydrogenase
MKRILITGATDGLGKAIARKLQAAGHTVIIWGRDEQVAQAAAQELGDCQYVFADVRDVQAVRQAVANAGDIDVLVNNAGIWIQDALETNNPERIKEVLDVNTLGTIYATQAVLPGMKQRGHGRIINVISQAGLIGKAERAVYSASKWAITGFTKSMQLELKPVGIAVTGLYPGAMNTKLFERAGDPSRDTAMNPDAAADAVAYVCGLADDIDVPELGIQSLSY